MRLNLCTLALLASCASKPSQPAEPEPPPSNPTPLAAPEDFADMATEMERSLALYGEMAKVLTHPRCTNCHPPDDRPRQGMEHAIHEPPVWRGEDGHGVTAMRCDSCHQDHNLDHARIPGAPHWHLAPLETAWLGREPGEICLQIKDPERNGNRDLETLHDHMAHDALVGWAWHPGARREPAPGTQERFGELVRAWIDSGAHCPGEGT